MAPRRDTRTEMVRTAATLFQRQGFAATGWRQVVAESETPWGSQSHHFPGGKEELAVEALASAAAGYGRLIEATFRDQHPVDAIRTWTTLAAEVLAATDWADGCPIATVALERAHEGGPIGDACQAAFGAWRDAIADGLANAGANARQAAPAATLVLAAIEGALLLARTQRDRQPLIDVGEQLTVYLETVISQAA